MKSSRPNRLGLDLLILIIDAASHVRAHGLVGVLDDAAASEQVVEAGHLLTPFEETQRVESEGTRLTGDQRESDDACEHGGVSTLRV